VLVTVSEVETPRSRRRTGHRRWKCGWGLWPEPRSSPVRHHCSA